MLKAAGRAFDFPFYTGAPVPISPRGWAILMVSIIAAFVALVSMPFASFPASLIPAILFASVPLATLAALTGRHWKALFRSVGPHEIGIMVLTAVLAMVASAAAAVLVTRFTMPVANPLAAAISAMSAGDYVRRLVPTAPQLVGEELLTILPFLAILWLTTQRLKIARRAAITIALVGSTALFATAHLSTYNWQAAQCFGVIGSARIVLTLSYVWTRNLWVPIGAHMLNDWTEFTFIFGFGHVPIGT